MMGGTGGITVHDGANGRPLFNLPEQTTWISSADGTRMVTLEPPEAGSRSSQASAGAQLRDGGTGIVVAALGRLGGAAAASVALFSPDGTRLVVVDATRQITIRDGRTGAVLASIGYFTPVAGSGRSLDAAFSPDSRLVALLLDNHKAVIYDARNGKTSPSCRTFARFIRSRGPILWSRRRKTLRGRSGTRSAGRGLCTGIKRGPVHWQPRLDSNHLPGNVSRAAHRADF